MRSRVVVCSVLALMVAAPARQASARDEVRLELYVTEDRELERLVRAAARALARQLPVRFDVVRSASGPAPCEHRPLPSDVRARVWFSHSGGALRLELDEGTVCRFAPRHVATQRLDAATREIVVQILYTTSLALVEDRPLDDWTVRSTESSSIEPPAPIVAAAALPPRAPPARPTPSVPPDRATGIRVVGELGARYTSRWQVRWDWAHEVAVLGGVAVGDDAIAFVARATFEYAPQHWIAPHDMFLPAQLWSVRGRLEAGARVALADIVHLDARLGGTYEYGVIGRDDPPFETDGNSYHSFLPSVAMSLSTRLVSAPAAALWLELNVAADVWPVRASYVMHLNGEQWASARLWYVRPQVGLGLLVRMF